MIAGNIATLSNTNTIWRIFINVKPDQSFSWPRTAVMTNNTALPEIQYRQTCWLTL